MRAYMELAQRTTSAHLQIKNVKNVVKIVMVVFLVRLKFMGSLSLPCKVEF